MKAFLRCLALVAALCVGWALNAQSLGDYTFSTGVDATKWITVTDSTNLLGTGNVDGRASSVQNIGFTFPFASDTYTQFSVNSDGNLRLGSTVTGTSSYTTPFSSSAANSNNPKINFLGCDGYFHDTIHYVFAENTVDANNDSLLVVEFSLGTYSSNTREQRYKWQIHLYPDGDIVAVFPATAPAQAPAVAHQKGLCFNASNGVVITPDNQAHFFNSGSSLSWEANTWPAPGTYYSFSRSTITCTMPSAITLNSVGTTTASLSFTPTGTATSWIAYINPAVMGMSSYTINDTNASLILLTPNTEYTVSVRSICGEGDTSNALSMTFRTNCSALTSADLPYTENFEAYGSGSSNPISNCWTKGTNNSTAYPYPYSTNAISGNRSLYFYSYRPSSATSTQYYSYAALPELNATVDVSGLTLYFNSRRYSSTTSTYHSLIQVGVMSDPTDTSTFELVQQIDMTPLPALTIQSNEINFASYTGTGKYIAFFAPVIETTSTAYNYIYIDDIELMTTPTCIRPVNVAVSDITSNSVTVSWTPASTDQTDFVVAYGTSDILSEMTQINVTGTSTTLTGLANSSTYYVYVKAVCSTTDESNFTFPISFNTLCGPTALPYTENFDNLSGNLPNCWTKVGSGTVAKNNSTTYAHSGSYSLKFSGATSNLIVLPEMDAATNTLTMSFWTRPESFTNSSCGTFSVGYVTDIADASTFVALDTFTYNEFSSVENKEVNFASAPADAFIAFRHNPNSTVWYWFVDDIEVSVPTPECVAYTWTTGDSTGNSYYTPVNNYYRYTLSETIIDASEIGGPMRIDTISFHYMHTDPITDKFDVTIWLQPTTKSAFSSTSDIDLLDSSIAVQIFSDSLNFSQGWNDIVLPTPYFFDGTTNLMVIVDDNSNDYNSNSHKFSTTACSDYKTITWYSDNQNPDPVTGNNSLNGNAFSSSKTRYQYRVRMALKGCDMTTCHKPSNLVASTITPTSVTLSWSDNNNDATYTVVNMIDSSIVYTGITAGNVTISGLTPETSYAFGVYANCSADDSSFMATVTLATPATCVIPSGFASSNITSTNATLTWSDNTNIDATYTIYDMSDTSVVATGLTGNTYTVTGLTPNTSYTFGIVANCSATDVSGVVTINLRTSCVPETLPFTEDFSANLSSNLCWRGATGTTAEQVFAGAPLNLTSPNWSYASTARDGLEAGHYYKNVYGSNIKSWIITPAIDLSTVTSAQLSFDVALTDYYNAALPDPNGDTNTSQAFMVIVSTDGGNTWSAANATVWQNGTGDYTYASLADTVYQNKVISLNQYVGNTIKIAFYCQSLWSGGDNDLHIDNIAVTEGSPVEPNCHVSIYAEDSYGDGWNGNTITIIQGTDTIGTYSMEDQNVSSTRIYDTVTFEVLPGIPISFEWTIGNWANEASFTIVNGSDATVYSCTDGSTLSNGVFFTLSDACPSCSSVQDLAIANTTTNSVTLTWSNDNTSATYTVYDMSDTSVVASGITATTYTITGLTAETNYQFGVVVNCSATDSSPISTINVYTGYCSPNPTSVDGSGITSVSFGGMTNTIHPNSASYANYSSMIGNVPAGTTATVDITYATGYTYGTIIWVDWNNNLVFDGNEVVYTGVSGSGNPATLTATFNIPATQALGSYRMRIVGADSYFDSYTGSIEAAANANPCASYSWGVAEDYTLNVITMPACLAITNLSASATSYSSVSLNWNDTINTGATYTVYNMSDTSVIATGITTTSYTVTGLTPNTNYTFGVVANCSATDASLVTNVTIHTPCVALNIPFYESFDTSSTTLPCWSAYSMNTANTVSLSIFNSTGIALRFSSYSSASDYNQYAFSPVFNYTGTESMLNVSVQYATYGSGDHLYFGYITPTDTVWSTDYYTTSGQSDVQTYTANIPTTATQIAFHYYGNYAYYAWVDSVSVTEGPAPVTMTISSADIAMGTTTPAPGTYTYQIGDTVTVSAIPSTGYRFDYWVLSLDTITDTVTTSTFTGVLPAFLSGSSISLVAYFSVNQYTLTMATSNTAMGTTIPAPGTYAYTPGDTLTISAIPTTNCHFVQWSDGDTNATRSITVNDNVTYTAIFDYNPITITLVNADTAMGTVTPAPGVYTFHVGDTASALATPANGYHFNQWIIGMAGLTDSMTSNPVTMVLPTYLAGASITLTATYAPNLYHIDVYSDNNDLGTVSGTGQYAYNTYATITATPNNHCVFVQWNDGDSNAVRNVLVTGNASYTATFAALPQYEVTIDVDPENAGTVTGAGIYYKGETVTLTASPNEGYRFVGWAIDGSVDPFDYIIITHETVYSFIMSETHAHHWTALFEEDVTPAIVTVHYDSYAGNIFINEVETNTYQGFVGDTIVIHAIANSGFRFVNWIGADIENPTSATISYVIRSAETSIDAVFEQIEGIDDVNNDNITIYSTNNNIIVRGAEQQTIRIFDVVGRLVAQRTNANDEETIAMSNTGVYLVQVGNATPRRVVVRR